jgi:hypothetical protein
MNRRGAYERAAAEGRERAINLCISEPSKSIQTFSSINTGSAASGELRYATSFTSAADTGGMKLEVAI